MILKSSRRLGLEWEKVQWRDSLSETIGQKGVGRGGVLVAMMLAAWWGSAREEGSARGKHSTIISEFVDSKCH